MAEKIMVTGASGMVGRALCEAFHRDGSQYVGVVRTMAGIDQIGIGDINSTTNWKDALQGVRTVIHTAARVHQMSDDSGETEHLFQEVNTLGTINLARQALEAGVGRFIFISTIKVLGEGTDPGESFTERSSLAPKDAYSRSKADAEIALLEMADTSEMEIVILRPPLVYGPGVKGNFVKLLSWVSRGIPLPLAAIQNRRTLLGLENLVSFIQTSVSNPKAANEVFLVGDDDMSTTQLLTRLGIAMGKPARLFYLPPYLLIGLACVLGRKAVVERLLGSLQLDTSKARDLLGWKSKVSTIDGLRRTADAYRSSDVR